MPRTVVPPLVYRGKRSTLVGGDGLSERLVKYVPAETLGFFVPTAAQVGAAHRALLIVIIAAAALGSVGYLWLASRRIPAETRPLVHFYVLAVIAFFCWAVGTTSNTAALVGLDSRSAAVVLAIAVFVIPVADDVLTRLVLLRRS